MINVIIIILIILFIINIMGILFIWKKYLNLKKNYIKLKINNSNFKGNNIYLKKQLLESYEGKINYQILRNDLAKASGISAMALTWKEHIQHIIDERNKK